MRRADGYTLPELLIAAALLALAMPPLFGAASGQQARQRMESTLRRLAFGLEMGRVAALRQGSACVLALEGGSWQAPGAASLPACGGAGLSPEEGLVPSGVEVEHNLPALVRFSSNGLVLDGGTLVVRAEGMALARCLVISPPLGVVRQGRYEASTCLPES
jgi:prepilin-type N-terminal cleavage/methylation domain-containing protein